MRSIRLKLVLASFLVVAVPAYLLNRYAIRAFDRFTSKALEEEMIGHAFMVGEQYKAMVLGLGDGGVRGLEQEFSALLRTYGPQVQSRLMLVSPDGGVLFDSQEGNAVGQDVSARREIAKAMSGRYGANWELVADQSLVFYYSALPIKHDGRLVGIAYVTRHTSQITKAIGKMVRNQRLAMLLAVLFAALVSAVMAQTMTRRLRRLSRAATDYARGDAPFAVSVGGRDEIGELGRSVADMASEIERRNEYNRDFVSAVMHELKTPVTAIKGAAEVLQEGAADDPDARAKFLSNIRYEADRLTRIVGELTELTKLDVETLRGQKHEVDYVECVREIVDRLLPTFEGEHADFDLSLPDGKIPVHIVPGRIDQVIANLVDNALRYTPVSGRVELRVVRDGGEVLTSVQDTGPGIPIASQEKVFDKFYTTERRDVPRDFGSGLGLAIAKSIVENHQGRIRVESTPGQGARFTFSLPVAAG